MMTVQGEMIDVKKIGSFLYNLINLNQIEQNEVI